MPSPDQLQTLADLGRLSDADILGVARDVTRNPKLESLTELTATEAFALWAALKVMCAPARLPAAA